MYCFGNIVSGDYGVGKEDEITGLWYTRSSRELRPYPTSVMFLVTVFQSTQPSRTATCGELDIEGEEQISIHAALANCDLTFDRSGGGENISIHAALANCDGRSFRSLAADIGFQSTQLSRTATYRKTGPDTCARISIHAALANCDPPDDITVTQWAEFQSTQLSRTATDDGVWGTTVYSISIHAALANCDLSQVRSSLSVGYFNPRSSRELRPLLQPFVTRHQDFNPRSSRELRQQSPTNIPPSVTLHLCNYYILPLFSPSFSSLFSSLLPFPRCESSCIFMFTYGSHFIYNKIILFLFSHYIIIQTFFPS